jgi:clan AA aspartic protease
MILGKVTTNREAIIDLMVSGPAAPPQHVEAVIDTGFNGHLTLSSMLIGLLNLPLVGNRSATLGDGSTAILDAYLATVSWHGRDRDVLVLEGEGEALSRRITVIYQSLTNKK